MKKQASSPEIHDADIFAYLDGEADSETVAQIEASEKYQKRAKDLDSMQRRLVSVLYRHTCPDSAVLGEYHLGLVDRLQARAIANHLRDCPHCMRELAALSTYLGEEEPKAKISPLEKARVLIARLISPTFADESSGAFALAPAFALRGDEQKPYIYEAEGIQVALEVQEEASQPGEKTLVGLISGMDVSEWVVHLEADGEEAVMTKVDEHNNFVLEKVSTGEYSLIIISPDIELHIPKIRV